jgi:hypothetical protein
MSPTILVRHVLEWWVPSVMATSIVQPVNMVIVTKDLVLVSVTKVTLDWIVPNAVEVISEWAHSVYPRLYVLMIVMVQEIVISMMAHVHVKSIVLVSHVKTSYVLHSALYAKHVHEKGA